jgi:hypothetical protein
MASSTPASASARAARAEVALSDMGQFTHAGPAHPKRVALGASGPGRHGLR